MDEVKLHDWPASAFSRLQRERDQIELDLIQMAEQCERLRAALEEIANASYQCGQSCASYARKALANEEGK